MSNNPIKSREEIDLERTLDTIDYHLNAIQEAADNLPPRWQPGHCDKLTAKLDDVKHIAMKAMELW